MPMRRVLFRTALVIGLGAKCLVEAGDGRRLPESDLAAPGAPLYEHAVTESVRTLMSKEEQAELGADGRPPSPGPDYFWCEQCKAYHKRQPPASPGQPAGAQSPGNASVPPNQPGAAPDSRPPSPGPDYYWCEQCKSYHLRQAPAQPGGPQAGQAQGAAPVAGPPGAQPPGGDYYYCDKCKSYHRRQTVAQHPTVNEDFLFGGGSNAPGRSPSIGPKDAEH